MPVGIPDLHLTCPGKVLRGLENCGAALTVFFVQGLDVIDAEPHPGPRLPLVSFRQVDAGSVSGDTGEVVTTSFGVGEAEDVDVVPHASGKAGDIQDRIGVLTPRSHRFGFPHVILAPESA